MRTNLIAATGGLALLLAGCPASTEGDGDAAVGGSGGRSDGGVDAGLGSGGGPSGSGGRAAGSGGSAGSGGVAGSGGLTGAGGKGSGGAGSGGATGSGGNPGSGGKTLAATPPMGWNSWNTFGCNMNEALIKGTADAMVSSGMAAVGYEYVNLDDCWMDGRDSNGVLKWNTSKFPSGIPALATYVHNKGLKIGIYETPNTVTCVGLYGGIPRNVAVGSLGHETTDANTFAKWGIDYLKYDKCQGQLSAFAPMRDALRASGREIFLSINPGDGTGCVPGKCSIDLPKMAHMWRIGFDINASWSSMVGLIDQDRELYSYAGPGHWNDPDMLEVGKGMTAGEDRVHFGMWAILAAPLIAGNDIRSMSATTKSILTAKEVIAVDQDPLGVQGRRVATPGTNIEVWSKTLSGTNTRAVALLNRSTTTTSIKVDWTAIGLPTGSASVRDLFGQRDLGSFSGSYTGSVPGHDILMLKITTQ